MDTNNKIFFNRVNFYNTQTEKIDDIKEILTDIIKIHSIETDIITDIETDIITDIETVRPLKIKNIKVKPIKQPIRKTIRNHLNIITSV